MPNMAASLWVGREGGRQLQPHGKSSVFRSDPLWVLERGGGRDAGIGTKIGMMQSGTRLEPSSVTDKPYDPGRATQPLRTSVSSL